MYFNACKTWDQMHVQSNRPVCQYCRYEKTSLKISCFHLNIGKKTKHNALYFSFIPPYTWASKAQVQNIQNKPIDLHEVLACLWTGSVISAGGALTSDWRGREGHIKVLTILHFHTATLLVPQRGLSFQYSSYSIISIQFWRWKCH